MKLSTRSYRNHTNAFTEIDSLSIGSSRAGGEAPQVTIIMTLGEANEQGGHQKMKLIMTPEEAADLGARLTNYAHLQYSQPKP